MAGVGLSRRPSLGVGGGGRNTRSHSQTLRARVEQVAAVVAVKRVARSAGRLRDPKLESVAQSAGRVRQKAQPGKLLRNRSERGRRGWSGVVSNTVPVEQ